MKLRLLLCTLLCISFSLSYGQLETFGIIGSGTPTGWDSDTDLTPNEDSTIWTIQIELVNGEVKFRPNDVWDDPLTDWGGEQFPYGDLLNKEEDGNAPNIPVYPGLYDVTVDLANKTYSFQVISDVAIIGAATPGGWGDPDTDMIPFEDNPNKYWTVIDLTADEFKFRTFNTWDSLNYTGVWGEPELTTGGGNIVCPQAGNYRIEVDLDNLTWSALENKRFETIGIIGSATPGGWEADTPMSQNAQNPDVWMDTLPLIDGAAKFRADEMWTIQWGSTDFPSGNGGAQADIPVTEGNYFITLNTSTGDYNFRSYGTWSNVGLIGVNGDFNTPVLMDDVSGDGFDYMVRVEIGDDNLQFVTFNDPSEVTIYGSSEFPAGTAVEDGSPIPTAAGEYFVTFSAVTGTYNFEEIIEYDQLSLVGASGPFLAWPEDGDMGARDTYLNQSPDNGDIWTGTGIELIDFDPDSDGGVKFRAETAWSINWGAVEFPGGIGTQNGDNIQPVAGTYDVTFNSASGEYLFVASLSTQDVLNPSDVSVYPNPATDYLTIDLSAIDLIGDLDIKVYDIAGRLVSTMTRTYSNKLQLHVSELQKGSYFMQISSESFTVGKKFSVR